MSKRQGIAISVLAVIALLVSAFALIAPTGIVPVLSRGVSHQSFEWVDAKKLTVRGDADIWDNLSADDAVKFVAPTTAATGTPAIDVDQKGLGDVAVFRDSGTPEVWIHQDQVESDIDINQDARVHINPAATAAATTTPDAILKASGTNDVLVVQNASATSTFRLDESGNMVVVGTSDLQGNVSDSLGSFTIADVVLIVPPAGTDTSPLIVTAISDSQTSNILVVNNKTGTAQYAVDVAGNQTWSGYAIDVIGEIQLRDDVGIETDGGANVFTVDNATGATVISSTVTAAGLATLNGGITVDSAAFSVADVSGNVATTGQLSVAGTSSFANDVTISAKADGGNALAKNELAGLIRVKMVSLGGMTNGATETTSYMDDTPGGEWTIITATVISTDTSYYRVGAASLKVAFGADAAAYDGVQGEITNDNLESNESVGFWILSDIALDAGDLVFRTLDTGPVITEFAVPAVSAGVWTWVEVNITALAGGTGDVVDDVQVCLKDTTLAAFNIYLDGMYKWDATDEEALGNAILTDGVLSVMTIKTDTAQANTILAVVEYTDYFVHYESGVDFLVTITDQSTYSGIALIAY